MKTLVKMIHGSHMYGTNTKDSDVDYKGIFMPSAKDFWTGDYPKHINKSTGNDRSKNSSDDVDEELFSLPRFFELACSGEMFAIDMLHAGPEHLLESSKAWECIQDNRHVFYTRSMQDLMGYVKKQAYKYGIKGSRLGVLEDVINAINFYEDPECIQLGEITNLPENEHAGFTSKTHNNGEVKHFYEILGRKYELKCKLPYVRDSLQDIYDRYGERAKQAKENKGVDWKAMSHALRVCYQLQDIYDYGGFSYPLDRTDILMNVKSGNCDFEVVEFHLLNEIEHLKIASKYSKYPDKVDLKQLRWLKTKVYALALLGK